MLLMIEGIDAVGKTTLARKLHLHLNKYKKTYYTNQFDTSYGTEQRARLLSGEIDCVDEKISIIRECRTRWMNQKIHTKNLSKTNIIVDRFYLSLMAYQGLEGVIPIESPAFFREHELAKDLYFNTIMIYIRATDPRKMIKTPRDYIEKRPPEWHEELQTRYDLLYTNYSPMASIAINVTPDYKYSHTIDEIVSDILQKEQCLLSSFEAKRLRKKLKANHIFSCMRKAKQQRKLPF